MQIKKYDWLIAAALTLAACAPCQADAAVVVVDSGGVCTLPNAISCIREHEEYMGCVDSGGGAGDNTIILDTDVTLTNRLTVMISVTIEGQGHTIQGSAATPVFFVTSGSTLTLNKVEVKGGGDGIYLDDCKAVLNNSIIRGNAGRGIYAVRGAIVVNNSTVSGNGGAGVNGWRCGIGLNNATVSGNADGVFASESLAQLQGSLISGNKGFELKDLTAGTAWQTYSNVLGHSGKTNAEAFSSTFMPGGTDLSATSDGANPTALGKILRPLADNGGITQTHALPAGSPAIDLYASCCSGLGQDQRGHDRPFGEDCDAGAFEFDSTSAAPQNINMEPVYHLLL